MILSLESDDGMAAVESLVSRERAAVRRPESPTQWHRDDLEDSYRKAATEYRRDDEIEARTDHHCWIWKTLADLSSSFGREIWALDAGCGTGRHFHCLKNVKSLVGLDLSPEMLRAARAPIRAKLISVKEIELVCGDVHKVTFPPRSFDLIYSLGMFGYGCELTVEVLNKFHDWLSPDGILLIDVSDSSGVLWSVRFRAALRKFGYPMLPGIAQKRIDKRGQGIRFSPVSRKELSRLVRQSAFPDWEIYRRPCHSPCWSVDKLECIAGRGQLSPELVETFRVRSSAPAGV
jgi:SAM-dependent methyltransferase